MTRTTDPLKTLTQAAADLDAARTRRNNAIKAARTAGHTWRTIATAANMTENGARRTLQHVTPR